MTSRIMGRQNDISRAASKLRAIPLNPEQNWRKIMTLIENNFGKHAVLSLAAFSFLLVTASSALGNPVNDPDVPATPAGFEPRTIQEQVQLAGDYLAGHGVAQDSKRAAFWYEKAAGAGDPQAQLQI